MSDRAAIEGYWRSRRQHQTFKGKPKVGYSSIETANAAAKEMRTKYPTKWFTQYLCDVCEHWHVANSREDRDKFWTTMKTEIGPRAAHNLAKENTGTPLEIWRVLMNRGSKYRDGVIGSTRLSGSRNRGSKPRPGACSRSEGEITAIS